jgi:hypothetical protein
VTCAESIPFITASDVARETAHTFAGATRVRLQQAACRVWHVPAVRPDFVRPVVTDVPTIMFSNEFDAATPVWIARADLPGFSHGRQIIDHQFGHVEDWDCFLTIANSFFASGDVARVADGCAARPTAIVFRRAARTATLILLRKHSA